MIPSNINNKIKLTPNDCGTHQHAHTYGYYLGRYTTLMKSLFSSNNIFLYNLCHHLCHLFSLELPGQYYSTSHSRTDLYSCPLPTEGSSWGSTLKNFFSITYHNHICHNSPHTHAIYFFHICYLSGLTTFETNLYPRQYHLQINYVTIEKHQHLGKVHKDIFFGFSPKQYGN